MNVSLTPELDRFVQEQVGDGMYKSASEVVREALRLLARRQMSITRLERILDERLADHRREPMDSAFWDRLRDEAKDLNK